MTAGRSGGSARSAPACRRAVQQLHLGARRRQAHAGRPGRSGPDAPSGSPPSRSWTGFSPAPNVRAIAVRSATGASATTASTTRRRLGRRHPQRQVPSCAVADQHPTRCLRVVLDQILPQAGAHVVEGVPATPRRRRPAGTRAAPRSHPSWASAAASPRQWARSYCCFQNPPCSTTTSGALGVARPDLGHLVGVVAVGTTTAGASGDRARQDRPVFGEHRGDATASRDAGRSAGSARCAPDATRSRMRPIASHTSVNDVVSGAGPAGAGSAAARRRRRRQRAAA